SLRVTFDLFHLFSLCSFQLETLTVDVKQNVTLTCDRLKPSPNKKLFWIRIISGHFPEFLGGTYLFDNEEIDGKFDHITTKQEPGTFVLRISEAKLNDTGLYYCVKNDLCLIGKMTPLFLNFIFVQGDEDPQVYSASVFNKTSWQQGRIYTVVVFQQTSTCKLNDPLKKAVFSLKQI
uniref:Ig-like domain-containing protein n=1 Tax=Gouania willdenowi TaxID=441366 RepID=A0A8C5NC13_GOUWI